MAASGTTRPRRAASGCAKTATPPALWMRPIASTASSSCLATWARPPSPIHSAVNAADTSSMIPASTMAVAMCGRPTAPRASSHTRSQDTGAPSSFSRATIARARGTRSSRSRSRSLASSGSAGSKR